MNARWQPGGDLYAQMQRLYGTAAANQLAALDAAGQTREFQQLLSDLKPGGFEPGEFRGDESTLGNLLTQLYNEPLNAPLEAAAKAITAAAKAVGDGVKSAAKEVAGNWGLWILVIVVVVVLFLYLGGTGVVSRRISRL